MNASVAAKAETFDCRPAFAETLVELAGADPRIVAVCNDSVGSSNLTQFLKTFPDRLINVGIAEQDMIGVAAGLANGYPDLRTSSRPKGSWPMIPRRTLSRRGRDGWSAVNCM